MIPKGSHKRLGSLAGCRFTPPDRVTARGRFKTVTRPPQTLHEEQSHVHARNTSRSHLGVASRAIRLGAVIGRHDPNSATGPVRCWEDGP
jgi:hypothetical protein